MYHITKQIRLVPFERHHISNEYKLWFTDQKVTKYNSHGVFPKTEKDYENFLVSTETNLVLAIETKACPDMEWENTYLCNQKHIGNVSLQAIDWINRSAELAIIIGDKEYWGQGIGRAVCKKILEHGFQKMNLNRIYLGTTENNFGMRKITIEIGMEEEGTSYRALYLDGEYRNIKHYYITKYMWL